MSGAAADIRRAEPLRHNALAAELAGVAVDDVAAVLEVLAMAVAAYWAAVGNRPKDKITLRQGIRVVVKNWQE
jgi:hypothetical protein